MIPICWIYWDPKPEIFTVPFFHWPILWYGVLFALGFALGFPIFVHLLTRYFFLTDQKRMEMKALKKRALSIADQLTFYIVVGTVLGARIGHFLFYERPLEYFRDPLQIFRIWEGGLASHGGVVGIILATCFFSLKIRSKERGLTPLRLLDFLSVPAALAAAFIRIGNFFNQEVLGTPTNVSWAVLFAHPADGSLAVPRHPVQLYEAFLYFLVFLLLFRLSYLKEFFLAKGKMLGLFFILVFGFRFFIESLKVEQSHLLSPTSFLTMGQILSLPLILVGLFLIFKK